MSFFLGETVVTGFTFLKIWNTSGLYHGSIILPTVYQWPTLCHELSKSKVNSKTILFADDTSIIVNNQDNNVINVKFWRFKLHSWVFEVTCHIARVCWQLCSAVHYTVENAWAESLPPSTLYITQRCKVIGLTHLLIIYVPLTLKIATYVETALSLIFRRSYHYVYEIHLASNIHV